jgi:hypothetical protein
MEESPEEYEIRRYFLGMVDAIRYGRPNECHCESCVALMTVVLVKWLIRLEV